MVQGKTPQVWLGTGKEQVVAIVGKRGSGKSFTLGVLCEGLSLATSAPHVAVTTRPRAVLLFDPLDTYWTTRLPVAASGNQEADRHYRLAVTTKLDNLAFRVESWVPGTGNRRASDPSWFKTLQLPVPELGLQEWELLLGVSALTDPMGQALADLLGLVSRSGYRIRGEAVAPTRVYSVADLAQAVHADELTGTYHAETIRALRQRLIALDGSGLFSAQGTTPEELLVAGQLSVVLLGRLPMSYREAVIAVLTRLVTERRAAAAFTEKRLALDNTLTDQEKAKLAGSAELKVPRTVIALDEAQTVLSPGAGGPAKEVFIRLVKEGRNLGLSVALATQQPSAIDQKVLSQVETFIAHQLVTEPDIKAVRDNLKSSLPDSIEFGQNTYDFSDLMRTVGPGQCIVSAADSNTNPKRTFVMTVRARATVHGGIEL